MSLVTNTRHEDLKERRDRRHNKGNQAYKKFENKQFHNYSIFDCETIFYALFSSKGHFCMASCNAHVRALHFEACEPEFCERRVTPVGLVRVF